MFTVAVVLVSGWFLASVIGTWAYFVAKKPPALPGFISRP